MTCSVPKGSPIFHRGMHELMICRNVMGLLQFESVHMSIYKLGAAH